MPAILIYEVECQLDPDVVADYDAWLPGHIRDVLACAGFLGATIEAPQTAAGEPKKRLILYRVEHAAALDHLRLEPLLDLGLRLGEGTGAALAMTLCVAACRLLDEMATFEDAGVTDADGVVLPEA